MGVPSATLLVGSLLAIVTGVVYAAIGLAFLRRARSARVQVYFALYWIAVAFYGVSDGAWSLLVPIASPPVALGETILYLKTIFGGVGFFGLVMYLTYLYRGDEKAKPYLAVLYAVIFAVVLYSYVADDAIGQKVDTWRSGLVYARSGGWLDTAAVVLLFAPPLVAAIAYARLYARVDDAKAKRRILVTSLSFAAFFGGLLFGWLASGLAWWPPVEKLLGLAAGLAVFAVTQDRTGAGRSPSPMTA